jgi:hypothetical protein
MLPGITPALMGAGQKPPTYGVDQFTKSLMKFDGPWGLAPTSASGLVDFAKPSRVWNTTGPCQTAAQKFGTSVYAPGTSSGYVWSPINDPDYNFSGDFTIDFWALVANPAAADGFMIGKNDTTTNLGPYLFYFTGGTLSFYSSSNNVSWDIAANKPIGAITNSVFNHFAVQRSSSVWTLWYNGTKVAEWAPGALIPMATTNPVIIGLGNGGAAPVDCYIDELRFSSVARYSANFTPQRFPYYGSLSGGNDAATKLLMHGEDYTDSAAGAACRTPHVFTATGAAHSISTAQKKFGASSIYFNGSSPGCIYTLFANSFDLQPATSDFTVDFWYYRVGLSSGGGAQIIGPRASVSGYAGWLLYDLPTGRFALYMSSNGTSWGISAGDIGAIASNQWVHFAMVKSAALGNIQCYRDGSPIGAFSAPYPSPLITMANNFAIGGTGDGISVNAYMDEIRFSDVARWTAPFTPPAAPYA